MSASSAAAWRANYAVSEPRAGCAAKGDPSLMCLDFLIGYRLVGL